MKAASPTRPAVIYAAKSSEDVRGSIPEQLKDGRKLAAELGLEVEGREFHDEAKSAFHGDRGPGLADAMAECERLSAEHGSCALIVQRSDRLARGDGKQARHLVEVTGWAIKNDVQLFSVQDPSAFPDYADPNMKLLLGVISGMAGNQESEKKSQSVKKGMRRRAERGEWVGGKPPYGYTRAGRYEALEVVPEQVKVVRQVFERNAAGEGQKLILRALNKAGIASPTGKSWSQSAMSRILNNVAYIGKVTIKVDDGEGKHMLTFDARHEAIIDEGLWNRVHARKGNKSIGRADGPLGARPYSSRASCAAAAATRCTRARRGLGRSANATSAAGASVSGRTAFVRSPRSAGS